MTTQEIISSGLLESYVLGTCTADETAMVNNLCKQHPELVKEIEIIEETLINFSAKISTPINADLKGKIAAQLTFDSEESSAVKILSITKEREGRLTIYKLGMAASLLLFLTSLMYNVQLSSKLSRMNRELAELTTAKSYLADQLTTQQTSLITMNMELQILANPKVKTVALKGMNTLENHSAMIHWNTESNEVYFNARILPTAPDTKQYQLWAIVDGKPVDAGMIDLSSTSQVFQKMKSIQGAQAFAVTIEPMGGKPNPTMETMCLLGNV